MPRCGRWPCFGLTTMLYAATYCAPLTKNSAGQRRNGQVAGARDTVYGSEGRRTEELGTRIHRPLKSQ
jgi:hypothetical protein